MMALHSTDSKEIALYYIGKADKPSTKQEIIKNIAIAKSILELGYKKEHIIVAIDLYIHKMYSLSFIKYVIEEVSKAIEISEKENAIKLANEQRAKEIITHSEVDMHDTENRNKQKLERGNNISRLREVNPFDNLK